jgi:hypothetical protein
MIGLNSNSDSEDPGVLLLLRLMLTCLNFLQSSKTVLVSTESDGSG